MRAFLSVLAVSLLVPGSSSALRLADVTEPCRVTGKRGASLAARPSSHLSYDHAIDSDLQRDVPGRPGRKNEFRKRYEIATASGTRCVTGGYSSPLAVVCCHGL